MAYGGQCVMIDSALLRPMWCVACSTSPELSALYLMQGLAKAEVCCVSDYHPCCPPALASNTSIQCFYLLSSFGRTYPLSLSSSVSSASSPHYSPLFLPFSLLPLPPPSLAPPSSPSPSSSSFPSHPFAQFFPSSSFYPQGQIWLDDVDCSFGHEVLDECSHRGWGVHNCRHSSDVGVMCRPSEWQTSLPYRYYCYMQWE